MFLFQDRKDAGLRLASLMTHYSGLRNVVLLALPRGGVPVAGEISRILNLPLDIISVKKLSVPGNEELAIGAIASGDVTVFNDNVLNNSNISAEALDELINKGKEELRRREKLYRGEDSALNLHKKIVILVDDGLATGATLRAAITAIRKQKPDRVVIAVPVAASETCEAVGELVNSVITVRQPEDFQSFGHWYVDFSKVTDEEVIEIMKKAKQAQVLSV